MEGSMQGSCALRSSSERHRSWRTWCRKTLCSLASGTRARRVRVFQHQWVVAMALGMAEGDRLVGALCLDRRSRRREVVAALAAGAGSWTESVADMGLRGCMVT